MCKHVVHTNPTLTQWTVIIFNVALNATSLSHPQKHETFPSILHAWQPFLHNHKMYTFNGMSFNSAATCSQPQDIHIWWHVLQLCNHFFTTTHYIQVTWSLWRAIILLHHEMLFFSLQDICTTTIELDSYQQTSFYSI